MTRVNEFVTAKRDKLPKIPKRWCYTCGTVLKATQELYHYNVNKGDVVWFIRYRCPKNEGKKWFWQKHDEDEPIYDY